MPPRSVPALILRGFAYGETSRILRLLTADHGVISAIARGARRPKSRFAALLDPFGEGTAVVDVREGRDLQTLLAFDLTRTRRGLARDMRRYGVASVLAELLMRTATRASSPEVFVTAVEGLDAIETAEGDEIESTGLARAWSLVALLGFAPEIDACTSCGRPLVASEETAFDAPAGGVRCGDCPGAGSRLPAPARADLAALLRGHTPRLRNTYGHWILLERFLSFHVLDAAPLKALAFLLDVRRPAIDA